MSELLPCPFCGSSGDDLEHTSKGAWDDMVECMGCGARADGFAFWNDRAIKPVATDGLLASMALRYRHDFGLLPRQDQQTILAIMRQIHEEVVGKGFYSPDAEDKFKRAIKDDH